MSFQFPRPGKSRLIAALAVLAAVLAGAGVWYFGSYTKSPEYALRQIQHAITSHDQQTFDQYVDIEQLTTSAVEAVLAGMMDADRSLTDASRDSISNLAAMFRIPLQNSFRSVLQDFVRTGVWGGNSEPANEAETSVDSGLILAKLGLRNISFAGIDSLKKDTENGTATAHLRLRPAEAKEDFILQARLVQTDSGRWQVKELVNFRDFIAFIAQTRQAQLREYLETSAPVLERHDAFVRETDQKRSAIMRGRSLGDTIVRQALREIVTGALLPDWQARLKALESMTVPTQAQSIHRLRLRITKTRIEYCQLYGEWLDTRDAATIRRANELLHEARTMEQEQERLLHRLQASVEHI
ncbi:MAG: DUF2939 domain-containing protein [Schwartzia sp.]|nr:DUF2939 domain-containing protein [Schwartzia sp. (in: firmicutes)]